MTISTQFGLNSLEWGEVDLSLMTLDFWATTPSLVQMERMNEETKEVGILAAPVPGNVAGWAEAVRRYGKLSLAQVLQPAIEYAENGFAVNDNLSSAIRSTETVAPDQDRFFRRSVIRRHPTTARIFLPGGRIPNSGEILVQEDLAGTSRWVSRTVGVAKTGATPVRIVRLIRFGSATPDESAANPHL